MKGRILNVNKIIEEVHNTVGKDQPCEIVVCYDYWNALRDYYGGTRIGNITFLYKKGLPGDVFVWHKYGTFDYEELYEYGKEVDISRPENQQHT